MRQAEADGRRELVTPEGVDLRLRVGAASERAGAFAIDMAIILGVLIGLTIAVFLVTWVTHARTLEVLGIIWLLGGFLLRNFYFTGFELRPGAATPGKRALGLRVAARDGGRLTADAVFTRNALRELEFFLPLSFLLAQGSGVDGWLIALGLVWTGVFLLFPLFNRERLRVGDLVAGTMVVRAPKTVLRSDLAQDGPSLLAELQFTPAEVGVYGVKELHVLETVLRRNDRATVAAVASRIRRRIGRDGQGEVSDRAFLMAYYGALRGRLETRLLFGRRRRDKFDAA